MASQQQPLFQMPQQQAPVPPQIDLNLINCQYSFTPRFLSFQGQLKPQMAHIKFRDGTGKDQKTADYWILPGAINPTDQNREAAISDLAGLGATTASSDDSNVAFTQESFTGTLAMTKGANGQLTRKEIIVEIYVAKDQSTEYQLLKQVNINLAQFVDSGKVDDVISFDDVGVLFVFDMEVSQIFELQQ